MLKMKQIDERKKYIQAFIRLLKKRNILTEYGKRVYQYRNCSLLSLNLEPLKFVNSAFYWDMYFPWWKLNDEWRKLYYII